MTGTSPDRTQRAAFRPLLTEFIDPDHKLVLLADGIDWFYFEDEFGELYSHRGQPANPYTQFFCEEAYFQRRFRCDPSGFPHFQDRIGPEGVKKIFSYSIGMHPQLNRCTQVLSDTTV